MSSDPSDLTPLTPLHFMAGHVDCPLPVELTADARSRINPCQRWHVVQGVLRDLWNRWIREVVPLLNVRQRWNQQRRNIAVGDVVLAMTPDTPRGRWPLARESEVYPGPDGLVRVVDVVVNKKTYRRAITSLVPLEVE